MQIFKVFFGFKVLEYLFLLTNLNCVLNNNKQKTNAAGSGSAITATFTTATSTSTPTLLMSIGSAAGSYCFTTNCNIGSYKSSASLVSLNFQLIALAASTLAVLNFFWTHKINHDEHFKNTKKI